MKRKRDEDDEENEFLPNWKKRKKEKTRCLEIYHKGVKQVIFYGVGCSSEEIKSQITELFGLEGKKITYLNGDGFPVVGLAHLPNNFKLFAQINQEYNKGNDTSLKWDPTTLNGANFRISDDDRSIKQTVNTSMGGAFLNRKFVEGDKYFWLMEHDPLWCCVKMKFHYGTGKEEFKYIEPHKSFSLNYSTLSETTVENKGLRLVGFYLDLNTYKMRVSEHIHKKVVTELDLSEHKGSSIRVSILFKHEPKITILKSTKVIPAYFNDDILPNEDCPVCLDKMNIPYKVYATRCGHYFHKDCIVGKVGKCPICRRELLTNHDNHQQQQNQNNDDLTLLDDPSPPPNVSEIQQLFQQQLGPRQGFFERIVNDMLMQERQRRQQGQTEITIRGSDSESDSDSDSDDEYSDEEEEEDADADENGNLYGFVVDEDVEFVINDD
jgi:hypothetical protein